MRGLVRSYVTLAISVNVKWRLGTSEIKADPSIFNVLEVLLT
jgi:hypothetical protein